MYDKKNCFIYVNIFNFLIINLNFLNVDEFWQNIFRGGITLFAVLVNTLQTRAKK